MNRRFLVNAVLIVSLLANLALLGVYFVNRPKPTPPPMQPAQPMKETQVLVDSANFDFSDTKLSDESWKIPAPDTQPPPAPDAPLNVEIK